MPLDYEEARSLVFDILSGQEGAQIPEQWQVLLNTAYAVRERRAGRQHQEYGARFSNADAEIVREVFWDLFRQGYIMLGINDGNPTWPWFKITAGGRRLMQTGEPWRFHDSTSYLAVVQQVMPDLAAVTIEYLSEAVSSFYSGNLLAACVMLGVAAENEFLRLVEVAAQHPVHGDKFKPAQKRKLISQAIDSFRAALAGVLPQLPREGLDDVESHLNTIQAVIRVARNQAGHPNAGRPTREQVYVYLQLFAPFAGQVYRLRAALQPTEPQQVAPAR